MIRSVLIFGGGSAGFLAALTLKRRLPELPVTILRSKDIGIIGVGEGTTTTVGYHLHHYCNLDVATFYRLVEPQWKIGIRFEWGPRPYFNYVFGYELDTIYPPLPRGTGYYLDGEEAFVTAGLQSRLMHENQIWLRRFGFSLGAVGQGARGALSFLQGFPFLRPGGDRWLEPGRGADQTLHDGGDDEQRLVLADRA